MSRELEGKGDDVETGAVARLRAVRVAADAEDLLRVRGGGVDGLLVGDADLERVAQHVAAAEVAHAVQDLPGRHHRPREHHAHHKAAAVHHVHADLLRVPPLRLVHRRIERGTPLLHRRRVLGGPHRLLAVLHARRKQVPGNREERTLGHCVCVFLFCEDQPFVKKNMQQ